MGVVTVNHGDVELVPPQNGTKLVRHHGASGSSAENDQSLHGDSIPMSARR